MNFLSTSKYRWTLQTVVAVGHIDWPWPEVAHCRAELFGKVIVYSDTDVKENCLPVADIDFLFLDSIPQVRRGRFYFLFTLTTQF